MSARRRGRAPRTYSHPIYTRHQRRLEPPDLHARLVVAIGVILAGTFLIIVGAMSYALVFVTQPIGQQAPNDAAFIEILKTISLFLTGSLGGVLASNGLKPKPKDGSDTPAPKRET